MGTRLQPCSEGSHTSQGRRGASDKAPEGPVGAPISGRPEPTRETAPGPQARARLLPWCLSASQQAPRRRACTLKFEGTAGGNAASQPRCLETPMNVLGPGLAFRLLSTVRRGGGVDRAARSAHSEVQPFSSSLRTGRRADFWRQARRPALGKALPRQLRELPRWSRVPYGWRGKGCLSGAPAREETERSRAVTWGRAL